MSSPTPANEVPNTPEVVPVTPTVKTVPVPAVTPAQAPVVAAPAADLPESDDPDVVVFLRYTGEKVDRFEGINWRPQGINGVSLEMARKLRAAGPFEVVPQTKPVGT